MAGVEASLYKRCDNRRTARGRNRRCGQSSRENLQGILQSKGGGKSSRCDDAGRARHFPRVDGAVPPGIVGSRASVGYGIQSADKRRCTKGSAALAGKGRRGGKVSQPRKYKLSRVAGTARLSDRTQYGQAGAKSRGTGHVRRPGRDQGHARTAQTAVIEPRGHPVIRASIVARNRACVAGNNQSFGAKPTPKARQAR